MEKRVFLAIFLSFIVLVAYQAMFAPPPKPPVPAAGQPGASPAPAASPAAALSAEAPPPAAAAAPAGTPLIADAAARDIVIETDAYVATFTTQGAVLKSYRLRQYRDAKGEPLELVPVDLPAGTFARPFTMATDDAKESATLAGALYQPSAEALSLGSSPGTLTFQFRNDAGLNARKTFYFQPKGHSYIVNVEGSVDVSGQPRVVTFAFGPGLGLGHGLDGQQFSEPRGLQFINGEVQRLKPADIQAQPRHDGTFRYAGVEDHYFLAVALLADAKARADYAPVTVPVPGGAAGATRSFVAFSLRPDAGTAPSQAVTVPFFIGPKDFDRLRAADPQLVYAIDFGMFAVIVVPLLQALKWVHGYVGNYGWSIVVLTVIINIIIFPLRHRSMVSMKKMQALQPELKAIQDRYAKYKFTDPERQKMGAEQMALYKSKGVSPASGCVPMLLTMPILLAFYSLLGQAIELRGAPFVGWIHDLSAKDPTYVWPVLMGVSMFWQQKMMPTTADPMQQKIFLLMPVIFTFMFLTMPSGLVIYWLVSNILTIGQQYLTNYIIGTPRAAAAVRKG
jgi:YidC/Oxa1 family membrane protein insertase